MKVSPAVIGSIETIRLFAPATSTVVLVLDAVTRHQNGSEFASAWMSSATWSLDPLQIFGC